MPKWPGFFRFGGPKLKNPGHGADAPEEPGRVFLKMTKAPEVTAALL